MTWGRVGRGRRRAMPTTEGRTEVSRMEDHHGIHTIDTGFERPAFDASHLIVEGGRAAFVDTGTNSSVTRLLAALAEHGLAPHAVDWVILTHVHLDHAGGAGALMRELPTARLVVHPRGARHMIDPAALVAGAVGVYGAENVAATYGTVLPVPQERVVAAADGFVADLAGRPLLCLDTPGHAKHHLCIWDARSRAFFTGDTFGLSYREFDTARGAFIIASSTPVQFDPDAMRASIGRLLGYEPQAMYLTHYGRVGDVRRLAQDLERWIGRMVAIARAAQAEPDRHSAVCAALGDAYVAAARDHGCALSEAQVRQLLAIDIELNAQGLGIWLDAQSGR